MGKLLSETDLIRHRSVALGLWYGVLPPDFDDRKEAELKSMGIVGTKWNDCRVNGAKVTLAEGMGVCYVLMLPAK